MILEETEENEERNSIMLNDSEIEIEGVQDTMVVPFESNVNYEGANEPLL